ncbi:MAG: hypothetical protein R6T83_10110 [Salinibacter sp.]
MRTLVTVVLFLGLVGFSAKAQTIWSRPYVPNQVVVEAIVPDAPSDAGWLSGATFVTGTASLSENIEVAGELPVARYDGSNGRASTALGNPYVGLGVSSTTVPVLLEVGARLPVASSERAGRIGQAADMGRLAAFRPEEFSLSALANTRLAVGRTTSLRLRAGGTYASFSIPAPSDGGTAASDSSATAWRLQYDAQLWHEGEQTITGLSVTGRAVISSPRRTQHHIALSVMPNWARVQPGLMVGTSANDLLGNGTLTPFAGLTLSLSHGRF